MFTGIARCTGITSHAGALVTAAVVLTGAAILRGGAAVADSNQDEQFLALLEKEGIPALKNVPSLIYTAHKVCRELDAGMPADTLVGAMVNDAYDIDPPERLYAPGRLARTEARFITAAVEAYCPYDQSKIASIMANSAAGWNEPTQRVAASTHNVVNSRGDLREPDMINMPAPRQEPTGTGAVGLPHLMDSGALVAGRPGGDRSDFDAHGTALAALIGAIPSGEITDPDPPQLPAPSPPAPHLRTAPRPIVAPPPPRRPPPPPQQPPPPPQQPPPPPQQPPPPPQQPPPPPVVAPQPGDAAGSGGGGNGGGGSGGTGGGGGGGGGSGSTGGRGGGGPGKLSPEPPMPPGFVTLAP